MIDRFDNEYAFLSNFYEIEPPIEVEFTQMNSIGTGKGFFKNVEAAFQAGKANGKPHQPSDYCNLDPKSAKRMGRSEKLTQKELNDWNSYKKMILMKELLKKKFDDYHPDLQHKLLETGDEELIEGNWWHDTYWGVCNGVGENNLGKLLMEVRESLRNKS